MSELEQMRKAIFDRRLKSEGKVVHWSPDQIAIIRDVIWSSPEQRIRAGVKNIERQRSSSKFSPPAEFKSGLTTRSYLARLTTPSVDRVGDKIDVNGWVLNPFGKNPVVLYAHDSYGTPVARSSLPTRTSNSLQATFTFPDVGVSARADEIAGLVSQGTVRGISVGFMPLKFSFSDDKDRPYGIDFKEQELLEYSICPVPCNSDCLVLAPVSGESLSHSDQKSTTAPMTREERIADAQLHRRLADAAIARSLAGDRR